MQLQVILGHSSFALKLLGKLFSKMYFVMFSVSVQENRI